MNWQALKEGAKAEWLFHKRHPEMLLVWTSLIISIIFLAIIE